ncbi:MAG: glycosyltransferase [Acidobacteriaceae bacterium]|nr:glycosyltransferase [Acidobacteriaceae bacterium]
MKPSILAVIVLYKTSPHDSVSVTSLARALAATDPDALRLRVMLVDNSPEASAALGLFAEEVYRSAPENRGLAHAYNAALRMAQELGFDWLLTLDQDTALPENFLSELGNAVALIDADPQFAAVVPQIQGAGRTLSPYTFRWGALPIWFPPDYIGIPNEAVYALNSASLLRVSALRQVGGYDPRFWLDASDHAIFHALAAYGKRVYVAGNIQVQHQLSVLGEKNSMPAARYENLLAAESAFWDLHMNRMASWERNAKLAGRLIRQMRRGETELRRISMKHLQLRLLHTRKFRLRIWEREVAGRLNDSVADAQRLLMVSVCMASYNGERYIEEQIGSILPQLRERDELIVVDDASSDRTRELILGFEDPRIKLIVQVKNRGVVETFEHAVRSATGDILFLCDGDDIWTPDKVEKTLQAFAENPKARVVCSGLKLIDENGHPFNNDDYMKNREFTASLLPNLMRNRFQGSSMALRSSLLSLVLPFPRPRMFLHDAWIGMCNTMTGGGTVYIAEPLLYYRRHASNVSQTMGLKEQIVKRVQLTVALAVHWFLSC